MHVHLCLWNGGHPQPCSSVRSLREISFRQGTQEKILSNQSFSSVPDLFRIWISVWNDCQIQTQRPDICLTWCTATSENWQLFRISNSSSKFSLLESSELTKSPVRGNYVRVTSVGRILRDIYFGDSRSSWMNSVWIRPNQLNTKLRRREQNEDLRFIRDRSKFQKKKKKKKSNK
jgi:hypothetical protein